MRLLKASLVALLFVGLAANGAPVAPQEATLYDVEPIGTEGRTYATALNDAGQVSVYRITPEGYQPYVWAAGTLMELPVTAEVERAYVFGISPTGIPVGSCGSAAQDQRAVMWLPGRPAQTVLLPANSSVRAINSRLEIAGSRVHPGTGTRQLFWRHSGRTTWLSVPPGYRAGGVAGMNDVGWVVGSVLPQTYTRPCRWIRGRAGLLPLPSGFPHGAAHAVNNGGQIVGECYASPNASVTGSRACMWTAGGLVVLPDFQRHADWAGANAAGDVNEAGLIVGTATRGDDNQPKAVIWTDLQIRDLNELISPASGWTLEYAGAINNAGWILGSGRFAGEERPFLLKPRKSPNPARKQKQPAPVG